MGASLVEQFDLGIQDLLAGRHELARDRFEYILSLDPDYEGAAELLGQALLALDQPTPSPSPEVTLTPTATPDFGSLDSTFASAQEAFNREDWTATIDILVVLRGKAPEYRLDEVNTMLATSLRNRGMDKLMQGLLEQGIYDLTLAERFGPLDNQAATWKASAAFFTFANSYYGLNWAKAVEYFGQICASNIWGACARYAQSAREYARELEQAEDWCNSSFYYQDSMDRLGDYSPAETATEISNLCLTATAGTPTPTETLGTVTATATETPGGPTQTPSQTPTTTPTSAGTPTPTVTATETPTDTPPP
jgi:tetratricopeptide (TPR) repeat protein